MWFSKTIEEISSQLNTNPTKGLEGTEINVRIEKDGLNKLPDPPKRSRTRIFFEQFNDFLVFILIFAALVTVLLSMVKQESSHEVEYYFDAIIIVVVLLINALLGFYQEIKAEIALNSLQSMVTTNAWVIRSGVKHQIPSFQLVPGDIVEFNTGDRVPADLRIISAQSLKVNESSLTGESLPVQKTGQGVLKQDTPLAERINCMYMGTIVEYGRGKGIVVETGIQTEVGKISELASSIMGFKTPLQVKLRKLSEVLAKIIIVLSVLLILIGVLIELVFLNLSFNFANFLNLVIVGVSLAVAAIPEGLPIILTFTLAISVSKMAKRNAIVRKIPAVETLGSVTYILTDKTGTLTQNKLSLVEIIASDTSYYNGNFANLPPIYSNIVESFFLEVLNNSNEYNQDSILALDPLDQALFKGYNSIKFQSVTKKELIQEFPFDSIRKSASVIWKQENTQYLGIKGAPDVILSKSTSYLHGSEPTQLNDTIRLELENKLDSLTTQGFRVIGFGYRKMDLDTDRSNLSEEEVEKDLTFLGFLIFIDPPRKEVFDALETTIKAGITVIMITGDHPSTALTIAKQIGITSNDQVITGNELDKLDDKELIGRLSTTRVFARVNPEHKLRIATLLKEQGQIVAMTGDGVNDSPALVRADVGVAMGKSGTDAAKEAADIILVDDNFATLVNAVEEGRVVNDNIRKFTNYLLTSNTAEVLFILIGFFTIAFLAPNLIRELLPITETQILYLNLVTDSFLALALGLEIKERNIMDRKPVHPDLPIVTKQSIQMMMLVGIIVAMVDIVLFLLYLGPINGWEDLTFKERAYAQSIALTFLVITEFLIAVSYRSSESVFRVGFFSNRFFVISFVAIVGIHISILYMPILNRLFETQPIFIFDWVIILILAFSIFFGFELIKYRMMRFQLKIKTNLTL